MIRTPLCDLLHIEHPIVQGGMAWAATAELAAAVCNAGGLGIVGAGDAPAEDVREQLRLVRMLTGGPFGANLPLFTAGVEERLQVFIDEGVSVVTVGGGNAGPYLGPLQRAGIRVIPVVASVAMARRMARQGVDALIAEGMESGGHIGDVATMPLVPQVVDAVDVPVIAAGGHRRWARARCRSGPGCSGHPDGHPLHQHNRVPGPSELQAEDRQGS